MDVRTHQGMKMINVSNSYDSSGMVATRDPPLGSRPKSSSLEASAWRPKLHRAFGVLQLGEWNEHDVESDAKYVNFYNRIWKENNKEEGNCVANDTAEPSAEPKKCCFPCFRF